ncbi:MULTISPECIES: 8-oxo-dGTP diphosphatase [unclassified Fusibacter]|uniref:NUDIX hydrolase n=1 Tax=unclassified Fusibacter TaxID=2624464 RepID=UPI001010AAA6|nr:MULTISPECIES: 8-oxo-dGTP diphosphatase [unclassified Fusibacter]MCK8061645.1 8-oxo-dGTP diphosphatase [Fusibacter sp. A2]NPE23829.1 8-oxo-dGTP diphosphatase [Fusibacter sp. A1]RXV58602.1 8-oxo-dGTP diphosphatase [Fusibacter sp. A1]
MIVASLIYLRRDSKTLMLHRNKRGDDYHLGKYNGIGGKLEAGESPEDCALREIKEETGLIANEVKYRGHIAFPVFDGNEDWLCFIYECYDFEGDLVEGSEGSLHWIEDESLLDLPLWEGDPIFLNVIYHSSDLFSGKFTYEDKELKSYQLKRHKED